MKKKVAVIGAGISGIYAAKQLSKIAEVKVFEKSRGFGGRMSTRTRGDYQFDHGAQYFTAKSKQFQDFLEPYISDGIIKKWSLETANQRSEEPLYVSSPKMSSFCRHLASGLDVSLETKIEKVTKQGDKWALNDGGESVGQFDWVVFAIPSHQVVDIMPDCFAYKNDVSKIKMQGCYSLMLGFESSLGISFKGGNIDNSDIRWVAVNSSKPERDSKYSIIAHSTNQWAEDNIEADQEIVKEHLMSELSSIVGVDIKLADHIDLHRWRYANVDKQNSNKAFIDSDNQLATCGDWCIEGRVEAAFLSASYLVSSIKEKLG